MIIVKLKGGLGNQMFQYALGRRIALENNISLKLDISGFKHDVVYGRKYGLNYFNIIENIATEKDLKRATTLKSKNYIGKFRRLITKMKPYYKRYMLYEQQQFEYDSKVIRKFRDFYIDGYWQNEKYFKDIADILRKEFTLKAKVEGKNIKLAERIRQTTSVGIHFRNYAFVNSAGKLNNKDISIFGMKSLEYYHNAVEYIRTKNSNLHLFVFSDDTNLAKRIIKLKYPTTFVSETDSKDCEEMQLMSLCKHQIICNSTFGWWAAWLNKKPDKIVVAPKRWIINNCNNNNPVLNCWKQL